jgi:hypothetical protein
MAHGVRDITPWAAALGAAPPGVGPDVAQT